jgi:hypothetical protein
MTELETIREAIDDKLRRLNTAIPGRIESYNAARREADVLPLIREKYADGTVLELKPIKHVPVLMPSVGGVRFTLPVAAGDTVLILFAQRSLDRWLSDGGVVDAGDIRMHSMSDAIAIPGLFAFGSVPDSGVELELTTSEIRAGAGGTLRALLNDLAATVYNGHTHVETGGTTQPPTQQMGPTEETTVLKAE